MEDQLVSSSPEWFRAGHRFYPLGMYFRHEFGEPVWKISIDAHFSCPNVDGTVGHHGCIFCNTHSYSPGRRLGIDSIELQIEEGIKQLRRHHNVHHFIAYFQPSTNTYAPLEYLEEVYSRALKHPAIVGLAIGTRPDVVSNPVLDLLAKLGRKSWISLELGVQSSKDESLQFLNRGHNFAVCEDAVARLRDHNIRFGIHLILGLPGESREDMIQTSTKVGRWCPNSIKIHHLYVVRNTVLADKWEKGEIELPSCEDYAEWVVDCLERLPETTVIDRLSGDMSPEFLLAPAWTAEKHIARQLIEAALIRRNTRQGMLYSSF